MSAFVAAIGLPACHRMSGGHLSGLERQIKDNEICDALIRYSSQTFNMKRRTSWYVAAIYVNLLYRFKFLHLVND